MATLPKRSKLRNIIIEKSFIEIINDRFKGLRAAYKYCYKELDKNTSQL